MDWVQPLPADVWEQIVQAVFQEVVLSGAQENIDKLTSAQPTGDWSDPFYSRPFLPTTAPSPCSTAFVSVGVPD